MPRPVSRFGNDGKYRERSAKLLAAIEFTILATPFVYQGEELGMTNAGFDSMEHYRDVDAFNYYKYAINEAGLSEEEALANLRYRSRDNARTPMQWDASEQAGFTDGTPWIEVNKNKDEINAEAQLADENSVFNFYKKAIALRAGTPALLFGDFVRIESGCEHAMVYERRFEDERVLVAVNMSDEPASLDKSIDFCGLEPVLDNALGPGNDLYRLEPWQAVIYK